MVLVRIITPVHDARYQLSDKFGISAKEAPELLRQVHEADFQTGVAFHVGSQCRNPQAFSDGVKTALDVIQKAAKPVHYLDVGGGFPAFYEDDQPPPLEQNFDVIHKAFEQNALRRDCVLMCEPGRGNGCQWLLVAGAYTNAAVTRFNEFFPETFVTVDAPPLLSGR